YLNHDTLTDIITFRYSEHPEPLESDIYISIERVKENALQLSVPFENELHRVMVHGVLHLLGFKDKTAKQKGLMREEEDFCLGIIVKVF
ncbi:MAG: rRNA maturation RNase YbeY, partial [Opitutaceae bacterium]|nr:rRNA maturation RNase YbeY [Cytophagales bacterium]